jgi:WD40 repeat protein/uncharacterized caspase-like protein
MAQLHQFGILRGWTYLVVLVVALTVALLMEAASTIGSPATNNQNRPQSPPELVLQTGHSIKVNGLALSSDKRLLASASADNTIRLWDVSDGNELRSFVGHDNWVTCVAFSPDGKSLASGSLDRSIRIWDIATGKQKYLLAGHGGPVQAVAFSNDGTFLVSGSADSTAKVWDVSGGREVKTLTGHSDWVTSVAFSGDKKWIATGSKDKTVRLWDVDASSEPRVLKGHIDKINCLAFSPDGRWLASGGFDHAVKLWKLPGSKDERTFSSQRNVIGVAFSVDGLQLLIATDDKLVKLWDVNTGSELSPSPTTRVGEFTEAIAFSADRSSFVTSADKAIELWDRESQKKVRTFDSRATQSYAVGFSADGGWIASGGQDRTVRLWDSVSGRELPALSGHTGYVTSLSFSKDGRLLASASLDRTIRLWDTTTGQEIGKLIGHDDSIDSIAFSTDSQWLASSGSDKTVRIWNVGERRETKKLTSHIGETTAVAFSADGRFLASASVDKTVRLWDTATWTEQRVIDVGLPVETIAFSPDSRWLTVGSINMTIKLYEVASGNELRSVKGETGEIRSLAFSPDGRWLASASSDTKVTMWDAATLSNPRELLGHSGKVNSLSFSSGSAWLISGSEDGSIVLWDVIAAKQAATLVSFRDTDDWMVVTPDGLFDGSPNSWSQILWRFSGNTQNEAPVELFFNEFYSPGLLAEVLNGTKPSVAQVISLKDRRQPRLNLVTKDLNNGSTEVDRTVAIKIELAEAKADREHLTGSGVRDVRLFRNGSLVKVWHGDIVLDADGKAILETNVAMVAGQNALTAYAFNHDNIKSSDAKLWLVGNQKLSRKGTAYIMIVGINQYANADFNLRYAVPDAQDFGAQLQQAQLHLENFENIEIIPLFDTEATKANIGLMLGRFAGRNEDLPANSPSILVKVKAAQPEDAVVIYFAGHGTAPNDGHFYLVPHDLGYYGHAALDQTNLKSILEHSISDKELEDALEKIDAGQVVLVIDACNSGQALESEEKRRGPMNAKGLAQLAYEKGMYILTAAQSYQVALERRQLGHGYLTYALVEEGLKTQVADTAPKDGQITLKEWLDYAVERVPQMQFGVAKDAQGRLLEHQEETKKRKEISIQRPRVFYRQDVESKPLIVAVTRTR